MKTPRPEKSTADALIGVAQSYHIAARRLAQDAETFGHVAPAFYLLCSYAMELAFKALYKVRGAATEDDLVAMGHNLKLAYDKAVENRLHERLWTADIAIMVDQLDEHHKNHVFRYTPTGTDPIRVPHPDMLLRTLNALMNEVSCIIFEPEGGLQKDAVIK